MNNEVATTETTEIDFSKFSNLINPKDAGQLSKIDIMAGELIEIKKLKLATIEALAVASFKNQVKQMLEQNAGLIMGLQNSPMGFKTDKKDGYDQTTVIECAVVALSYGCHLSGNHFNIIAKNAYITKEGYFYKLCEMVKNNGLNYRIVHGLAEATDKFETLWKIESEVFYNFGRNKEKSQKLSFIIKGAGLKKDWNTKKIQVDAHNQTTSLTTQDQIRGKADRKSMHWLFCTLASSHIPDVPDELDEDIIEGKVSQASNIFDEVEKEEVKKVAESNKTEKTTKAEVKQEVKQETKQEKKEEIIEAEVVTEKEPVKELKELTFEEISKDHWKDVASCITWIIEKCVFNKIKNADFKAVLVAEELILSTELVNTLELDRLIDICAKADSIIAGLKK